MLHAPFCLFIRKNIPSGITGGGGKSAPQRLLTGKFLLTYREKVSRQKLKRGGRKEGKLKMEGGKSSKMRRGPFFFFFFFGVFFTFQNG